MIPMAPMPPLTSTVNRPHRSFALILQLTLLGFLLVFSCTGCKTTKAKAAAEAKPAEPVSKPPARLESEFAPPVQPKTTPPTPGFAAPPRSSLIPKDAQAAAAGIPGGDRMYSFSAKGLDIVDALALFARTFELNILPDPDVTGTITVDFKNLPLEKAMDALLEVFGYYAEYDRGLIRIKNLASESFTIDYLRLVRGGTGSSSANIASGSSAGSSSGSSGGSSSSSGSSGGGSSGSDGAGISINQSDTVRFWEELETQMTTMVTDKGKFVINRTAGQIFVTDQKTSLDRIRAFLSVVRTTLHRQVDIEARIYEVVLNDEYHLGVDWQNLMAKVGDYYLSSGGGLTPPVPSSSTIVQNPLGGGTPGTPALSLAMGHNQTRLVVDALKEMGKLRIVSQPRIRTLNNQAAMIKVGLDKPFFRQTTETLASTTTTQETTIEVQVVTIGTILSITPQISEDGFVSMDISPVITRLVGTARTPDGKTTAPEVDIKQTSSLVRMKSGTTVVIGGLIQDESYSTVRKVPLLGDIPLIGRLVTGNYDNRRKTELVIFITPTVVD